MSLTCTYMDRHVFSDLISPWSQRSVNSMSFTQLFRYDIKNYLETPFSLQEACVIFEVATNPG